MKTILTMSASLVLLTANCLAQTATWIGPGPYLTTAYDPALGYAPYITAPPGNWRDPANWDTGVVPNGTSAIAVANSHSFYVYTVPRAFPGALPAVIESGPISLAELRFRSSGGSTAGIISVTIGTDSSSASLSLAGPGITWQKDVPGNLLSPPHVKVHNGILEFTNDASTLIAISVTESGRVTFRDRSSIITGEGLVSGGGMRVYGGRIDFHDQASARTGSIEVWNEGAAVGQLEFHGQATADRAKLNTVGNGRIVFSDNSSAGSATMRPIQRPGYSDLVFPSAEIIFRDSSSAGTAYIEAAALTFSGSSSANTATIDNSGYSEPTLPGIYRGYAGRLTFLDESNAGQALILNGGGNGNIWPGLGELRFLDHSSAGSAVITNNGNIEFADQATLANARIISQSGSYLVGRADGLPPESIATGRITFKDQSTGGNEGRIEIASSNSIIDFSGLQNGRGQTGRALLTSHNGGSAIVPDDGDIFYLRSITNTTPGGIIYLGGTTLTLGSDNMILSARITDVGGQYGSLAGEPLRGGGLTWNGGTLTITNPHNDYTGYTSAVYGRIHLDGGSISSTSLMNNARLTGTGTVRGSLWNGTPTHLGSGTVVSPGNSIGTITVQDAYTQYSDARGTGVLQIEIASAEAYDRLQVGGPAYLAGTLNYTFLNGYVPVGSTTFDFLTSNTTTGQFNTVNGSPGFGAALSPSLSYSAKGVGLHIAQNPFSGFSNGSTAAYAIGTHLDATLRSSTGDYRTLIANLNTLPTATHVGTALEALAPDRYSVLAENGFATATALQVKRDRWLAGSHESRRTRGLELAFEASYRKSEFDASSQLSSAQSRTNHGMAGGIWQNDGISLGASLAYETGDIDLDSQGSRAEFKSLVPALFFQYSPDRFLLQVSAAFSDDSYDLQRRIVYPGVDLTALSQPSGQRTDLSLLAGYAFPAGRWTITPLAGLFASNWSIAGFTESAAGAAGMTIADTTLRSTLTRLGVEGTYRSTDKMISPRFAIIWLHEWQEDRDFSAGLIGANGAMYRVPGRPAETDIVQASLGLDWRISRQLVFSANAGLARGQNSDTTSDLSAGFRWEF